MAKNATLSGLDELASLGMMVGGHADDKEFDLIDVELIYSKAQPRKVFDRIDELAESLKTTGQQQPIVVSADREGRYVIEQGERRWRAAKLAGIEKLYCVIVEPTEDQNERIIRQLTENVQRDDMKLHELSQSVATLINSGMTVREIAKRMGKQESYISNLKHVAELPEPIARAVEAQKIQDPLAVRNLKKAFEEYPVEVTKQLDQWLSKDISDDDAEGVISRAKVANFVKSLSDEVAVYEGAQESKQKAKRATKRNLKSKEETEFYPDKTQLPRGCKLHVASPVSVRVSVAGELAVLTLGVVPPKGKVCVTIDATGEIKLVNTSMVVLLGVFNSQESYARK